MEFIVKDSEPPIKATGWNPSPAWPEAQMPNFEGARGLALQRSFANGPMGRRCEVWRGGSLIGIAVDGIWYSMA